MSENRENMFQEKVPIVESLIFSSDGPLSEQKICEILPELKPADVRDLVAYLNEAYRQSGRSFHIKRVAGGFQMYSLPEYSSYIEQLYQNKLQSQLSQKALETLAIIAYKQPVTKQDIEGIRGVNVDGVMKTLLKRNLITISGRAQAPGSPFLYKTTKKFLEYFGLDSLNDLPKLKEIDEIIDSIDEKHPSYQVLVQEIPAAALGMKDAENGVEKDVVEQTDEKE
ncbi:MAG: hypothetical protein Kow0037_10350 [Calditrichia bacterium]